MSDFKKTPTPNLVRHRNGTYYLRARFGAGPERESLRTKNYQTARLKLAIRLEELQHAGHRTEEAPATLAQAVDAVRARIKDDPAIEDSTRDSYLEEMDAMLRGRATVPGGELRKLTPAAMRTWWKAVAGIYAAQRANHMLNWARRAIALARKLGGISRDPAEELKPVKVPRKRLTLLSAEQFRSLLAEVRKKKNRHDPNEASDWIEMMVYGGPRPGEVKKLWCEDLDEKAGIITI